MPARVDGEVKERLLKLVDEAVAGGWAHTRAYALLGVADVRVHRWRARLLEHGAVVDRAPGGDPVHRLLAWEGQAILDLIERWGGTDRSHRKLAHRGSYTGVVFVHQRDLQELQRTRFSWLGEVDGLDGERLAGHDTDDERGCPADR